MLKGINIPDKPQYQGGELPRVNPKLKKCTNSWSECRNIQIRGFERWLPTVCFHTMSVITSHCSLS